MPTELQQYLPSSSLPEYRVTLLDSQRMFPDEKEYAGRMGFVVKSALVLTNTLTLNRLSVAPAIS